MVLVLLEPSDAGAASCWVGRRVGAGVGGKIIVDSIISSPLHHPNAFPFKGLVSFIATICSKNIKAFFLKPWK